jgi:hypothetical protein
MLALRGQFLPGFHEITFLRLQGLLKSDSWVLCPVQILPLLKDKMPKQVHDLFQPYGCPSRKAVSVTGNLRVLFEFDGKNATNGDLVDTTDRRKARNP